MRTVIDRLEFIVGFAEMNLEELDANQWAKLRDGVMAFMADQKGSRITLQGLNTTLSGPHGFSRHTGMPMQETKRAFIALQDDVRKLLYGVVDARHLFRGKHEGIETASVTLPAVKIDASYWLKPANPPFVDRNILSVMGPERDIFLFAVLSFLSNEPTNRLNRCPECNKVFVRVARRLYCSRRCVNRVNARAWRQRADGKEKNRARVAAQYEKKQKAKLGPKTKIMKKGESRKCS